MHTLNQFLPLRTMFEMFLQGVCGALAGEFLAGCLEGSSTCLSGTPIDIQYKDDDV